MVHLRLSIYWNWTPTNPIPNKHYLFLNKQDSSTPTDTYKPLPILNKLRNTQYRLRPTDTENLDSPEDILHRYEMYVEKGDDGLLALLLAREAVFGATVMAKCPPPSRN